MSVKSVTVKIMIEFIKRCNVKKTQTTTAQTVR